MSEYSKKKVDELKALLKQRDLPTTGNKADLVARLTEDTKKNEAPAKPSKVDDEDVIDWDDDDIEAPKPAESVPTPQRPQTKTQAAEPAKATPVTETKEPAKAASPAKAPEQKPASTEPEKTEDKAEGKTEEKEDEKKEEDKASEPVFNKEDIEKQIEQLQNRAKKWGNTEEGDNKLKSLERQLRFGEQGKTEGKTAKGLDEALPERREKRRRGDDGRRGDFKRGRRGGGRSFRGRRSGPSGPRTNAPREERSWMTDADREKANARAQRFNAAS